MKVNTLDYMTERVLSIKYECYNFKDLRIDQWIESCIKLT